MHVYVYRWMHEAFARMLYMESAMQKLMWTVRVALVVDGVIIWLDILPVGTVNYSGIIRE